jgi:hypothetical protein
MIKEFECVVRIEWEGNNHEAKTKEEYIAKLKENFYEAYNIELMDSEILDIKEIVYE